MKRKKFVHLDHGSDRVEYMKLLKKIDKEKVCPFCPDYFERNNAKPILRRGRHWLAAENISPYRGTKHHFLFVHKKHIESPSDMVPAAWAELRSHIAWFEKTYKMPAGGFFMRFGDGHYTGATVAHLHAQLLIGVKKGKDTFAITPTLGFGKNK